MNERKGVHKIMAYNTLTEREAFYCLCHVPGFGSATIGKLRERFGTYQEVWTFMGWNGRGSALSLKETQTIRNVSFHIKTARRRFS